MPEAGNGFTIIKILGGKNDAEAKTDSVKGI
jgi:hypothetical protein